MTDSKIYEFDAENPFDDAPMVQDEHGEMWLDDDWEAPDFVASVERKFPGWYLVKIVNFNSSSLDDIDAWTRDNAKHGDYSRVGWNTGCSYSVGVVFEHKRDAMMFKLRWR